MTTDAQKRAQARYDDKRRAPVSVRLNAREISWLDAQRQPGEGRAAALKRLAQAPQFCNLEILLQIMLQAAEALRQKGRKPHPKSDEQVVPKKSK